MWAQLIKTRLKPGREAGLEKLYSQQRAAEQPVSGLVRSTAMHDQSDHSSVYMLVVFDSEDAARARDVIDRERHQTESLLHVLRLLERARELDERADAVAGAAA